MLFNRNSSWQLLMCLKLMLRNCVVMLCEGVIHLSGYVMPEDEIPSPSELMTDSDEEDEEQKEELESEEDTSSPGLSRF